MQTSMQRWWTCILPLALVVSILVAPTACLAQAQGEREIQLQPSGERETPLELLGLQKPEIAGIKVHGFAVGSFSYNSHIQMVPEFAGGAPAQADPGATNFRFDKFGLGLSKTFTSWLSANAAIEVESHRDRHTHLTTAATASRPGCPVGVSCEGFGAEAPSTEINLDKFSVTGVVPVGNGLALSLGRFDVPFGFERHDEPFLLTATTSDIFRYGRPNKVTGFQAAYQMNPFVDVAVFFVNRWEAEITHDDMHDNNKGKTVGGRLGITPVPATGLLSFGIGGFYGPERTDDSASHRWVLDFDATWTPLPRLLLASELVYGGESHVSLRERGIPVAAAALSDADITWWGLSLLAHYDALTWLGLTFRYGYFDDNDGARTGVPQVLQSFTVAPILHLSALIPDLRPTGAAVPRTRHPIHWVDLKLEYRLNLSDKPVFSDSKAGVAILDAEKTGHQVQLQLVVNF